MSDSSLSDAPTESYQDEPNLPTLFPPLAIFRIDIEGLSGAEKEKLTVKRLLSHFADRPGVIGLLEHLDDSVAPWRDLVLAVVPEFTTTDPRKPFSMWENVDECFRDVITKMMSLDPARRITARETLEHPWFQNV